MKRYHIIIKTILGILGNLLFASCVDDNIEQNYSELNELVLKSPYPKAEPVMICHLNGASGRKGIIQPYGIFTAHPIHWFIM